MKDWSVYLVECSDGTYYCGVTNDIDGRIAAHNRGTGAKYTRGRRPVKLLGYMIPGGRMAAARLEYRVKNMTRKKKLEFFKRSITVEGG